MSGKILNVGFIGCGGFCSGIHIPNVAKSDNFKIRAFCDLSELHLKNLAEHYNPDYVTTEFTQICSDPDIDMIVCGTKPNFRLPIMREAIAHKKPLFVEKPMSYERHELSEMMEMLAGDPICFMVGFNRPYSQMMQRMKKEFTARRGETTLINYRLGWEGRLWPEHHKHAVFELKESTIIHETTHMFHLLNWLLEDLPTIVQVSGEGNVDNIITLTYPNNTHAVIISADNASALYPKEIIEINTNYNTLIGNSFVELDIYGDEGHQSDVYGFAINGEHYQENFKQFCDRYIDWRTGLTPEQIETGYYYTTVPKENKGHANELEYFRECILAGRPAEVDAFQGAVASIIAWEALKAWENKETVTINLDELQAAAAR